MLKLREDRKIKETKNGLMQAERETEEDERRALENSMYVRGSDNESK